MMTEDARNMVIYFIEEMGDITRWSQWEQCKHLIFIEYPELRIALEQRQLADLMLSAALGKIKNDCITAQDIAETKIPEPGR